MLSTNHLKLPKNLACKLASHYVGPFKVIGQINPVAFCFLLPDSWKVYNVFHVSQLKPAIGFVSGSSGDTPSLFQPSVDNSGEFEVDDILDSCFVHHGWQLVEEFLVKQHGYDLFETTWEPLSNLTNCPDVLSLFFQRRGLC